MKRTRYTTLSVLILSALILSGCVQTTGQAPDIAILDNDSNVIEIYKDGQVITHQYPRPLPAPSLPEPQFNPACSDREQVVRAGHILLSSKEQAETIIGQLKEGAEFTDLAWRYSIGPSALEGGDLGYFCDGLMVPEFWDGVAMLKVGEFSSAPVESQFG